VVGLAAVNDLGPEKFVGAQLRGIGKEAHAVVLEELVGIESNGTALAVNGRSPTRSFLLRRLTGGGGGKTVAGLASKFSGLID
jgi:hypothetical protein